MKIVELADGRRLRMDYDTTRVVDGHLLLSRGYNGSDTAADVAWPPGAWTGFWEEPYKPDVKRLRARLVTLEKLAAVNPDEMDRQCLEFSIGEARKALEQVEAMEATEGAPPE